MLVSTVQRIPIARGSAFPLVHETYRNLVVTRRSRCNYGNSHPRNVTSSRAAPAVLVLLVLSQPHCHSSSSSFSFSFASFLVRFTSSPLVSSLSLFLSQSSLPSTIFPLPFPSRARPWSLPAVRAPFTPFLLVLEAMHLRRTLTFRLYDSLRVLWPSGPLPILPRPALSVAVFFVLFFYFYFFLFLRRQE